VTAPVVTALRGRGAGRVAVELDTRPWRVLPIEAVVCAGLTVGDGLDRPRARALRRELRRFEARETALQALRTRDHTRASLDRRLAERGTSASVRHETIAAVARAGLVDDGRFAAGRASSLAARGAGNALIEDDLALRGVPADLIRGAVSGLEPEWDRAERILAARGRSLRTARYLAAKGFAAETVEGLVADLVGEV
jgi:regulatory protein